MAYKGEVRLFAAGFAPLGWTLCDGIVPKGTKGLTVPDLLGRVAIHADASFPAGQAGGSETVALEEAQLPRHRHAAMCGGDATGSAPNAAVWAAITTENAAPYSTDLTAQQSMSSSCFAPVGGDAPHDNMMPFQALTYITPTLYDFQDDDEPYLGEVRAFAGDNDLPPGWLACDGALQQIDELYALFKLIGTTYGGDGQKTFGIPNLSDSAAIGAGDGTGLTPRPLASSGGSAFAELDIAQIPSHFHVPVCATGQGDALTPVSALSAQDPAGNILYGPDNNAVMSDGALMSSGQGMPHENRQPFIAMRYMLCVAGIYPPSPDEEQSS